MIIAYAEPSWFNEPKIEHRLWDHLCRAYGIGFRLIEEWPELDGHIVVFDQAGEQNLTEFIHPEDCIYVFGRTGLNDLHKLISCDVSVRIDTPKPISLFGICAASMVLHDRMMKHGDADS